MNRPNDPLRPQGDDSGECREPQPTQPEDSLQSRIAREIQGAISEGVDRPIVLVVAGETQELLADEISELNEMLSEQFAAAADAREQAEGLIDGLIGVIDRCELDIREWRSGLSLSRTNERIDGRETDRIEMLNMLEENCNVRPYLPSPGTRFNPQIHKVATHEAVDDPGKVGMILAYHKAGYRNTETGRIIRKLWVKLGVERSDNGADSGRSDDA